MSLIKAYIVKSFTCPQHEKCEKANGLQYMQVDGTEPMNYLAKTLLVSSPDPTVYK